MILHRQKHLFKDITICVLIQAWGAFGVEHQLLMAKKRNFSLRRAVSLLYAEASGGVCLG